MKEQIKTWLKENGSYRDGYYLLEKIGADESVLRPLRAGLDLPFIKPAMKNRLREALQYLIDSIPEGVQVISAAAEPQAVKDLRDKAKSLHKEHAYLKAQLLNSASDEDRYVLAERIMDNVIPQLDDIYDRIREWEATGRVRGESRREIVSEVVQKLNRRGSIRSILSRLKKQLQEKDLSESERQEAEKKIVEVSAELEEIEQFLEISD
jgi:HPt (histidine-containing phosphotransfer) domain-containing protein